MVKKERKIDYNDYIKVSPTGYLTLGSKEHYAIYKDREKEYPTLPYNLYRKVLKSVFIKMWTNLIKDNWVFNAPAKMGSFFVAESLKSSGFYTDWQETRKKNKIVKKYNDHTNGRSFYISWSAFNLKNKVLYRYRALRSYSTEFVGSRALAKYVKECSEDPYKPDYRGRIL